MTWSLDCDDRFVFFPFFILDCIRYMLRMFPNEHKHSEGEGKSCVGAETWVFGSGLSVFPLPPEEVPQRVGVPRCRNIGMSEISSPNRCVDYCGVSTICGEIAIHMYSSVGT
jgi:hypothetical protein